MSLLPFLFAKGNKTPSSPGGGTLPPSGTYPEYYTWFNVNMSPIPVPSYNIEYFISPSGKDSGDGTLSSPWHTLNKALSVWDSSGRPANTCIWLRAGVYQEYLGTNQPSVTEGVANLSTYLNGAGGALGQELVIRGWHEDISIGLVPIFDGAGASGGADYQVLGWDNAHDLRIQDLWVMDSIGAGLGFNSSTNVRVSNVHILFSSGAGIEGVSEVADSILHHNEYGAFGVGKVVGCALFKNSSSGTDECIEVTDSYAWGNGFSYAGESSSLWFDSALSTSGGTALGGDGLTLVTKAARNVVFSNSAIGISSTEDALIYNNTTYDNGVYGVRALDNTYMINNLSTEATTAATPYSAYNSWSLTIYDYYLDNIEFVSTTPLEAGFLKPVFTESYGATQPLDWTGISGWASVSIPDIRPYIGAVEPQGEETQPTEPLSAYLTPEVVPAFNLPYWQPLEKPSWVNRTVWVAPNGTGDGTTPEKATDFLSAANSWNGQDGLEIAMLPGRYYYYLYGSGPGTITTNRKPDGSLYPGGQSVDDAQAGGALVERTTIVPSPLKDKTGKILIWTPPEYLSQGVATFDGVDVPWDYRRGGIVRSAINGSKVWGYGERPSMLSVGSNVTLAHLRFSRSAGVGLSVSDSCTIHAVIGEWCVSHPLTTQFGNPVTEESVAHNVNIKYYLGHHNLDRVKNGETADGAAFPHGRGTKVQYALFLFNGDDGMEFMYGKDNCEVKDSISGWSGIDVRNHNYEDNLLSVVRSIKTDLPRWPSHPLGLHGNGNGFKMGGGKTGAEVTGNTARNVLVFGAPLTGLTSNGSAGVEIYNATVLGSYRRVDGKTVHDDNGLGGGPYGAITLKSQHSHYAEGVLSNYNRDTNPVAGTLSECYFNMDNSEFKSIIPATPGFGEAVDENKGGWRAPVAFVPPPPDIVAPSAPVLTSATPGNNSVTLKWTEPSDTNLIKVYRKEGSTYDFSALSHLWRADELSGDVLEDSIGNTDITIKNYDNSSITGTKLSRLWRDGRGVALPSDVRGILSSSISLPDTGYALWLAFKRDTPVTGNTAVVNLGNSGSLGITTSSRILASAKYGTDSVIHTSDNGWNTTQLNIICLEVRPTGYFYYVMHDGSTPPLSSMTLDSSDLLSGGLSADTISEVFYAEGYESFGALLTGMGVQIGLPATPTQRNNTARAFLEAFQTRSGSGGESVDLPPEESNPFELDITSNGHFFNTFLLGDTVWFLHKYTPSQRQTYFASRLAAGFNTVLGSTLVLDEPDYNNNNNPSPSMSDSAWYQNMDDMMQEAEDAGLWYYVPVTWGAYAFIATTAFANTSAAQAYGAWVANRFKHHKNLIWSPVNEWPEGATSNYAPRIPYVRAIANGIKSVIPDAVITEHGVGQTYTLSSTAPTFGSDSWLTFNGIQTGPSFKYGYQRTYDDFNFTPAKPTVLLEGGYDQSTKAGNLAVTQRQQLWHPVMSGSAGYAYGNDYVYKKSSSWASHLYDTATGQMQHVFTFLNALSTPEDRIPAQDMLLSSNTEETFTTRITVLRDGNAKWVAAYLPNGGSVKLNLGVLSGASYNARWFNTSTGVFSSAGTGVLPSTPTFTASTGDDVVLLVEASGVPVENMTMILVITGDSPNSDEEDIISGFEGLGYTVSTIRASLLSSSAGAYDSYAFMAVSDWPNKSYLTDVANKTVPVMSFKSNNDSLMNMDMLDGTMGFDTATNLIVSDNTHPVTNIYSTNQSLAVFSPAPSDGMRTFTLNPASGQEVTSVATYNSTPAVLLMESGDTSPSGGTYPARRAHTFVSRGHGDLTSVGWNLLDRVAKWLKGVI